MIFTTHHDTDKKKKDAEGLRLSEELLAALAKFQTIVEDFQMDAKELEIIFEAGAAGQIMPNENSERQLQAENPPACSKFLSAHRNLPKQNQRSKVLAQQVAKAAHAEDHSQFAEALRFYTFEAPMPHKPVITLDVFDTKFP